jgi:hypothetical protein
MTLTTVAPGVGGTGLTAPGSNGNVLTSNGTAWTSATPTAVNSSQLAKAWVNFNGTGTVAIRGSFNVSSITDNGTGDYTVNFTTAFANVNYSVVTGGKFTSNDGASDVFSTCLANWAGNPATTYVRMLTGQGNNGTRLDFEVATMAVFSS